MTGCKVQHFRPAQFYRSALEQTERILQVHLHYISCLTVSCLTSPVSWSPVSLSPVSLSPVSRSPVLRLLSHGLMSPVPRLLSHVSCLTVSCPTSPVSRILSLVSRFPVSRLWSPVSSLMYPAVFFSFLKFKIYVIKLKEF